MEPEPSLLVDVLTWVFVWGIPLALLLVLAVLVRFLWLILRGTALLFTGAFSEARAIWERWVGSWLPGMDISARYNTAYCLHHEGRLDEALERLRDLSSRRPRGVLAGLTQTLTGATLVLLERSPEEADALIRQGDPAFPQRQAPLLRAHAALARGDQASAVELVATADSMPEPPSFQLGLLVMARVDRPLVIAVEAYLRGWYAERTGELDRARQEYARAAAAPRGSLYVHRARAAVERLAAPVRVVEGDEPPSSLSPLYLEKKG
jgi:tetratricopeptide (TPR) repeat protein